jgi:hypothetical protein
MGSESDGDGWLRAVWVALVKLKPEKFDDAVSE